MEFPKVGDTIQAWVHGCSKDFMPILDVVYVAEIDEHYQSMDVCVKPNENSRCLLENDGLSVFTFYIDNGKMFAEMRDQHRETYCFEKV